MTTLNRVASAVSSFFHRDIAKFVVESLSLFKVMFNFRDKEYSNSTVYGTVSEPLRYIWAGYFLFVILSSLIGDTAILIASIKYKVFKLHKVIVVIIIHIAFCDLMVTATILIPQFFSTINDKWIFGNFLCHFTTFLRYHIYPTGLLLICNMTTSKLLLLKYPHRFGATTSKKAHLSCLACWLVALIPPGVALLVDRHDIMFSYRTYSCDYGYSSKIWNFLKPLVSVVFMFIPTCIVVTNTICLLVLAKQVARRGGESLKWQGIMTTVLTAAVAGLSFLPAGVYRFGESFFDQNDESQKILSTYSQIAESLLSINTISNFYIYSLTAPSFRSFIRSKINASYHFITRMATAMILGEIM
jgi:hypothetical protein